MRIAIIYLSLLFVCCSKMYDQSSKKLFLVKNKYGSFDSIQKLMDFQESYNFYKDNLYSIARIDKGEWGGAIIFKDCVTKQKYAFYQSTIYAFGRSDSSYLLFSHSPHGLYGAITEIVNPKKLFPLCDTCLLPNSNYWYKISDSIARNTNTIKHMVDLNDSIFDYVAVFSSKKQLYIIKSTKWFSEKPKYTILCKLNMQKLKSETIDTLLNEQLYVDQLRPWPNNAPIYNPFAVKIFVPIRSRTYRGFIQIKSDTITIIKDNQKPSIK